MIKRFSYSPQKPREHEILHTNEHIGNMCIRYRQKRPLNAFTPTCFCTPFLHRQQKLCFKHPEAEEVEETKRLDTHT
jgi:hypothetical protein